MYYALSLLFVLINLNLLVYFLSKESVIHLYFKCGCLLLVSFLIIVFGSGLSEQFGFFNFFSCLNLIMVYYCTSVPFFMFLLIFFVGLNLVFRPSSFIPSIIYRLVNKRYVGYFSVISDEIQKVRVHGFNDRKYGTILTVFFWYGFVVFGFSSLHFLGNEGLKLDIVFKECWNFCTFWGYGEVNVLTLPGYKFSNIFFEDTLNFCFTDNHFNFFYYLFFFFFFLASWFLFFLGQHKKFLIALPEFLFFYIGLYFFSFLFLFSNSLIFVALGLVSVSLVTYFFLGSGNNLISSEISVKYYIVSSFALCLFFFGFWLIFLGSNTVNLLDLVCYFKYSNFSTSEQVLLSLGWLIIFISLIIKLGGAPFHFWVPDVYDGVNFRELMILVLIIKVIFLLFLMKWVWIGLFLVWNPCFNYCNIFCLVMLIIAFSSIFMGSFGAFKARTLKRFLAFSSIVHLGFLVVILSYFFWVKDRMVQGDYLNLFLNLRRLVFGSIESVTEGELLYFSILPNGLLVSLFIGFSVYIFFYFLTTFGLLFLVSQLKKGLRQYGLFFVYISDLKYFSYLKNFLALLLFIIIMFSFGGVPPFGGFFSKFMVFFIVINVGGLVSYWNWIVCLLLILGSVLSLFYYLRLIKIACFSDPLSWTYKVKSGLVLTSLKQYFLQWQIFDGLILYRGKSTWVIFWVSFSVFIVFGFYVFFYFVYNFFSFLIF